MRMDYFYVSSFFPKYVIVFNYTSFTSLVKFILRYFILFDAIINGIVLISLIAHFISIQKCKILLYTDFPGGLYGKKNLSAMWETQVQSLGWKDPLEKRMATHSSILACRIPWVEDPGGLQPMGLQRQIRLSDQHLLTW